MTALLCYKKGVENIYFKTLFYNHIEGFAFFLIFARKIIVKIASFYTFLNVKQKINLTFQHCAYAIIAHWCAASCLNLVNFAKPEDSLSLTHTNLKHC